MAMSIRPLSPDLQLKAETDLREIPSKIQDDLKQIREWLAEQPHLNARTEDQWLISFLRGCKFNHERTKQKLDSFYTARTRIPEFFADRDPFSPEIQEILKLGIFLPLQRITNRTAPRLLLVRPVVSDPKKLHLMSLIKVMVMILDILINEEDDFIVCGIDSLVDLKGLSITQMLQMTPGNSKKTFWCFQDAYPIRPQTVNMFNIPSFFERLFGAIKYFMSEKLRRRINVFNDDHLDVMYDCIPRSIIPPEYGGEAMNINDLTDQWKQKVESYRDWFLEDAQYCSDESKRPKKRKQSMWSLWNSIFGH